MRRVDVEEITRNVSEMCQETNYYLGNSLKQNIIKALKREKSPVGREVLQQILENVRIAEEEKIPLCQDTGFAVVFIELGQEVCLVGRSLQEAVDEGVRKGYKEGYLRKSIVKDPLQRENTGDNTPCILHLEMVPGDKIKIIVAPKGGGSENMSALKMMRPADGLEGVKEFVLEVVKEAGANACPPLIVGIGLGGTMEKSALLAKKALLRSPGKEHPLKFYAELERDILEDINKLGIGPQGLGGRTTALAVHIESYPTHIACLPVAVNLNCHVSRHMERII